MMLSVLMIIAGFGFKMAIAPWHMWVPDVYQGAPSPVAAFLSVASKASAFAVLMRILYSLNEFEAVTQDWQILFAVIAAVSMTFGNLLALSQSNFKRLLAYSTIAQAGLHHGRFCGGISFVSVRQFDCGPRERALLSRRLRFHESCGFSSVCGGCASYGRSID